MRRQRQVATAMILTLIVVFTTIGLAAAFLVPSITRYRLLQVQTDEETAFNIAEGAVSAAVVDLNQGNAGSLGSASVPISYAGGSYYTSTVNNGDGTKTITSTATFRGLTSRIVAVVRPGTVSLFDFAAFSDRDYSLGSNAYTDSFDSDNGTYSSQILPSNKYQGQAYAGTKGSVGSNASINLDSNAKVFGNANPGPQGTTTLDSNAYVLGNTSKLPATRTLPAVQLPAAANLSPQVLNTSANSSATIGPGSYRYSSLTLDSNSSVTIKGPATLVVDHFNTDSNSSITIDSSGGQVLIYGTGWFRLDSNSTVSSASMKAGDLQIYITTDNYTGFENSPDGDPSKPVKIGSNAALFAAVYAPSAVVRLDSNGGFFGAIVGKKISQDSNFGIHYDEALSKIKTVDASKHVLVSWQRS